MVQLTTELRTVQERSFIHTEGQLNPDFILSNGQATRNILSSKNKGQFCSGFLFNMHRRLNKKFWSKLLSIPLSMAEKGLCSNPSIFAYCFYQRNEATSLKSQKLFFFFCQCLLISYKAILTLIINMSHDFSPLPFSKHTFKKHFANVLFC